MYRSLVLIIAMLIALHCPAQSVVRGAVADAAHAPVRGCTVGLLRLADSVFLHQAATDSGGVFVFTAVSQGHYIISVQQAGYAPHLSNAIHVDSLSPADAGIITLSNEHRELGGVTVTGYKPNIEFKNGTVVMNVENNPLASGLTVLEMLKLVPGVLVDANGNITVNGRTNVAFMMNGRLQQIPAKQMISILGGMSAETIASVELIKNPSAKYDAAGTAGIINIVAKKVKVKGFSGNISENVSYGSKLGSVTAGMFNFRSNRLTVFTNVSYWYRDIVSNMDADRKIYTGTNAGQVSVRTTSVNYKRVLTGRAGMEYELTPRLTLGMGVTTAPSTSNVSQVTSTSAGPGVVLGYDHIRNNTHNSESYNNPSAVVYALYTDTNGTQLRFNVDYTTYHNDFSGITRSNFFDARNTEVRGMQGYRNVLGLNFNILTQKLDFSQKLSKTLSLEAGLKSSFVNNQSNFMLAANDPGTDVYYTDSSASNNYNYKERILAGYAMLAREKGRLGIQAGVRVEQTNVDAVNSTNGYRLHQDYLNLFPTASVNYKASDKHSLQLTYSRRIDRPGYELLNPMRVFNDPLNYSTGNPRLLPQYSQQVGIEHSYRGFLTNSFSYTRLSNSLYNYSYLDSGFVQVDTSINYTSADQFTYGLFVQMPVTKRYNMQASGTAIWGARYGMVSGVNTSVSTFMFMINLNNDIALAKNTKVQVNAMYCSPFNDGIQHYRARATIDVAVQQKLLKNKLTATLQVNDLLYTNIMRLNNDLPGQSIYFSQRQDSRRIRLVLNYRFGNMRVDRKMRTESDEAKRIKKTN